MTRSRRAMMTLLAAALALTAAGCPCPSQVIPREQLIAAHNANAAKVMSLWAMWVRCCFPSASTPSL